MALCHLRVEFGERWVECEGGNVMQITGLYPKGKGLVKGAKAACIDASGAQEAPVIRGPLARGGVD